MAYKPLKKCPILIAIKALKQIRQPFFIYQFSKHLNNDHSRCWFEGEVNTQKHCLWDNLPKKQLTVNFKRFNMSMPFDPELPLQDTVPGNTICTKSAFCKTTTSHKG